MNAGERRSKPLSQTVARQAASWLVCLRENASAKDQAACQRWREASPEHERAWQLAQKIEARFGLVPPAVGMPVLNRGRRMNRRGAIQALSMLVIAGSGATLAGRYLPWWAWTADQHTLTGQRRTVYLADETRVDMNADTAFDTQFDAQARLLTLRRGEVLVQTGADPQAPEGHHRPFLVQTSAGRIRALGTRFLVNADRPGDTLVAVLEGAVELTPAQAANQARVVAAGRQTRFSAEMVDADAPLNPHIADWVDGVLYAQNMSLGRFVAELRRYRVGVLRCDPAVAQLELNGVFQLGNIDGILAALPHMLPVQVVFHTRYWVTITAPVTAT